MLDKFVSMLHNIQNGDIDGRQILFATTKGSGHLSGF